MKITITYDNSAYDERLTAGWGFSCLIELPNRNILFDTGGDGPALLGNMQKLGIDPKGIGTVVLSHAHGDHANGLESFLQKNSNVSIYLPQSFPKNYKEGAKNSGAVIEEIHQSKELFSGIFTTGELPGIIPEQALAISTSSGIVVITGCAHPGIVRIVEVAKEIAGNPVHLVLGGFHFPKPSVVDSFRELGVRKVAPCHCTGGEAIRAFQNVYGEDFIDAGTGTRIDIP